MGRAVGQILAITAAAALVASGIGAAAGLALFGTTAGITIAGVGLNTLLVASSVLTAVGGLLAGGPKAPPAEVTGTTVKNPVPVRQFGYGRRRFYGTVVLFETASNGSTVDVYAFLDDEADGVEALYLNDKVVGLSGTIVQGLPDGAYGDNKVEHAMTLGTTPNTSFARVRQLIPSWTTAHRGDGVVTGYLIKEQPTKSIYFTKRYPQGDNVQPSRVIRATKNCFDPRDGGTRWTENPVLHLLHYLTTKRGYDYTRRIQPALQYWINAANICDEQVPLKNGGSEKRYRSCVSYSGNAQPKEVIASLLETFDGWFAPRADGAIVIYAGKLYEPTVTLGSDEIINYNLPFGVENESRVDQLAVQYVSEAHDWNTVDATPWGVEGLRSDGFAPQSPSYSQNRRLAKRAYSRVNEANRGTITTNLAGRVARGHRFINLNIEEGGITFFSGMVEVKTVRRNFEAGGLTIEWIAVDENIDDWNPATEEGEPAALGERVAPQPVETPVIGSAVSFFDTATDGGTGARVRITVASPPRREDYTWYARWKRTADNAWNEQRYDNIDPAGVTIETGFVPATNDIQVEVLYVANGVASEWSDPVTVNATTDQTPPDDAMVITLTNWSDTLDLVTDQIARAGSYRWRFYGSDGTTLVRTIVTSGRTVSYTAQQAAVDGARRAYVVKVAGVNSAGAGGQATSAVLTLPAPAAVTNPSIMQDGPGNAKVEFDQIAGVAGYSVALSTTANFNPLTQGFITKSFASPTYIQNLAATTYYAKVAAFDGWTDRPDLLNYSTEVSFTSEGTSGGSGGGGGGGGGGYCVTTDTLILMADGQHKRAGDVRAGDRVWTQHEDTMQWGAFTVYAAVTVPSDDVWFAQIGAAGLYATGEHRVWLSGAWVCMRDIGVPAPDADVVRLSVEGAHTYISNGLLSHNIKANSPDGPEA